jgi:hypothetical protein
MSVTLYDSEDRDDIAWPDTETGRVARNWLTPFLREGTLPFLRNVETQLGVLVCEDQVLPYSVSTNHPNNSYVCSPLTHYITYGREELHKLDSRPQRILFDTLFRCMGWWFKRSGFDRVVYVNNWLLSTNLYPSLDMAQIPDIHHALLERFRDRAIVFRSVDEHRNPALYQALTDLGYLPVFSRFVWYQDPSSPKVYKSRSFKSDRGLARRSGYEVVDGQALEDSDFERIESLYNMLYLERYSMLNPQFTSRYIREFCRKGILNIRVLRKEGSLDGFYGYYTRRGVATAPLFGYDTSIEGSALYPILSYYWTEEARQKGLEINCSAGVGKFKKFRGAHPVLESNMVYAPHVPAAQRCWRALEALLRRVAVPMIRKYET